MRWKPVLGAIAMLLFAGCSSAADVATSGDSVAPAVSIGSSADDMQDALAEAKARWGEIGPTTYILDTSEICEECDVVASETTVIDGLPIAGGRDSFPITMEDAFAEFERTIGHEQYEDHTVEFDPVTGALLIWQATFLPVGGDPRVQGDRHRVLEAGDLIVMEISDLRDETDCDTASWQSATASAFSIQLPGDLIDAAPEGVDSEVGLWEGEQLEVDWDYGWYSNPIGASGAGRTFISNESIVGVEIVRDDRVSIHYPRIVREGGEWNALTLHVRHSDPAAADLALCAARSLEWNR